MMIKNQRILAGTFLAMAGEYTRAQIWNRDENDRESVRSK